MHKPESDCVTRIDELCHRLKADFRQLDKIVSSYNDTKERKSFVALIIGRDILRRKNTEEESSDLFVFPEIFLSEIFSVSRLSVKHANAKTSA